ncbi:MAG: hypothetical protein HYV94_01805 [Candidatus Rokubacteria bacterium]|nr:hypothetical protein [Candidatus Rokubacteria bacterium]MBI2156260.1 hypothetical protein [Candidatus Rokubacteria bacterium]MBI2490833.1 hypothetical protein [Candidatus Rokubacteria bacterium]MBI4628866.1 hypothetical protein [Candidatus Rokubacteria bacterium]
MRVIVDTKRELERLHGDLVNDHLTFQNGQSGERHRPPLASIRYYTNLRIRHDEFGYGTLDLSDQTSLTNVQLVTNVTVGTVGGPITRDAKEIVRLDFVSEA